MWKKTVPFLTSLALTVPSMADDGGGIAAKALFYQDPVAVACTGAKCPGAPEEKKPVPTPGKKPVSRPPTPPPAANIGVSYQIRMPQSDGTFREVQPNRIFRSGERFQLVVKVNRPSYVYVDNLSPSNELAQIFPLGTQNNYVGSMGTIVLPQDNFFEFDGQPGVERLYVLISSSQVAERVAVASSAGQHVASFSAKCGGGTNDYAGSKAIGQSGVGSHAMQVACTQIANPDVMARQTDFISCTGSSDYAGSKAIGQSGAGTLQPACTSVTRSGPHRVLSQQESGAGQPPGRYYVKESAGAAPGSDRFLIGIELAHQ